VSYSIEILRAADNFLDKLSKQQRSDADAIEEAIGVSARRRGRLAANH